MWHTRRTRYAQDVCPADLSSSFIQDWRVQHPICARKLWHTCAAYSGRKRYACQTAFTQSCASYDNSNCSAIQNALAIILPQAVLRSLRMVLRGILQRALTLKR